MGNFFIGRRREKAKGKRPQTLPFCKLKQFSAKNGRAHAEPFLNHSSAFWQNSAKVR